MDDLLKEFLTETAENLAVIDSELVRFERNPHDAETLSNIFRLVHTIKGTCGFLGLGRLESLAHSGENVLGRIRDGRLAVTAVAVTAVLRCIDTIRGLLTALEETGAEPAGDDQALIAHLDAIAEGQAADLPAGPPTGAASPVVDDAHHPAQPATPFPVARELLEEVARAEAAGFQPATEEQLRASLAAERQRETAEASPVTAPVPAPAEITPPPSTAPVAAAAAGGAPSVAAQSIRVPVETLETLMTLVSELVLTRNQLLQIVRTREDNQLTVPLQRLSHITSELQEGVMKTRMQPIGNAWAKLPRIVRDLGLETGKKLELKMIGADTELDRQVLELIKDPLTHMVRNSADHGIESPAERKRLGKPETGTVSLNAYHEGGHIIIEIADDGRGLDVGRIREKILSKGLATAVELEAMTDDQAAHFIFRAGFSTAEKVTSVSGRGVGMDVVRTNIEKIGGTIDLRNVPGRGCTFIIKIPLTLAIVAALIIQSAGQRFAIPQISVVELVRVTAQSQARVETINGSPLLRLRDRLLPLADLRTLLKLDDGAKRGVGASEEMFVVVSQVGPCRFGVIVDEVFDTEEIVVKPVAPILRRIPHYAGNTILGDGGVIMILDPNGLAAACGLQGSQVADTVAAVAGATEQKTALLLFRAGGPEPKAIPLELVARLERIDLAKVEKSQGSRMLQYRNVLMPLIPSDPDYRWAEEGSCPVLVFTDRERAMGLVVDEIIDIVEDHLLVEVVAETEGVIGSAVVSGAATEIIDAGHYLTKAFPDWFATRDKLEASSANGRLLLVDDSPFFRSLLKPVLEAAGYQVTAVEGADRALQLRDEGHRYDAIISDIEMPGLNGFDFARTVRGDNRWAAVPMVALSSHTSVADFARGREVGFDDYVAKFDRDGLMASLDRTLQGRMAVAA